MNKQYRLAVIDSSNDDDRRKSSSWLGHWKLDKIEPVARRFNSRGEILPLLGVVADVVPPGLDDATHTAISAGKDVLSVTDGVVDDVVHLLVIARARGRMPQRRLYAHAKLLYELGVRQMMAIGRGSSNNDVCTEKSIVAGNSGFNALPDGPSGAFTIIDGSCGRLTPEFRLAMSASGFGELLPQPDAWSAPVLDAEQTAARGFGLCFSGFAVMGDGAGIDENLRKHLAKIAKHGLRRVSPTTSCLCGR